LIVDSSPFVRQELARALAQDPSIDVVGTAADADFARRKMQSLTPDVVTLDLAMPDSDGLAFLAQLTRDPSRPIVVVLARSGPDGETARRAMELGAYAFISRPHQDLRSHLGALTADLRDTIAAAARTRARFRALARAAATAPRLKAADLVIAIGVSTGGPLALQTVLAALAAHTPGIVIVQHMPERYTRGLAARLNCECALRVRQAADGDPIEPGVALVAPGDHHLQITRDGARLGVRVVDGPAVNHHRPSVDVLFHSAATHAGANALGIILTGMGADGAAGLLAMKQAGAATIAQNEASSIVFGMPKEAIEIGAVDHIVPLDRIATEIAAWHARQRPLKETHDQDSDCR
jgi:two-component system chemotaxis response regulator CheB